MDGVSIGVHYRHGKLTLGVTRGDGTEGDDITTNLKTVRGVPLELNLKNPPALLEVRGEAYMAIKEFDAINAKLAAAGEKPFPNARNATAGTLKQLDPKLVAQRPIRAVFYATGAVDGIEFKKHSEMLEALAQFGLPTQKLWWVCDGIEEVLKIYREKVVAHYDEDRTCAGNCLTKLTASCSRSTRSPTGRAFPAAAARRVTPSSTNPCRGSRRRKRF